MLKPLLSRGAPKLFRINPSPRLSPPTRTFSEPVTSSRLFSNSTKATNIMATATKIKLSPSQRPVYAVPHLTQESADKASELLQKNHEDNHIYFNDDGFHNHIAHHLLTIYALGAPPSVIKEQFDRNQSYQLPQKPLREDVVKSMQEDEENFGQHLGSRNEYIDYLKFFELEIEKRGWQDIVKEYLFSGTEKADDFLVRLFGGFLHPIIHLGFGIEFEQPAIIAEALAQTASHNTWMGDFLLPAEKIARENPGQPSKSLMELMQEGRANPTLVKSPRDTDGNKLREGVIGRASEEMAKLAAKYTVKEDELEARCAEMIEFTSYITFAAQRPGKEPRMDFFLMHDTNCSIFFPRFITDPSSDAWLSPANKARLLEWKGRTDLAQYVARASPELLPDEIKNYKAIKQGNTINSNGDANGDSSEHDVAWKQIFDKVSRQADDGHAAKLVRAVAEGERYCDGVIKNPIVTKDMWRKMGQMVLDSTSYHDARWVRSTGFDSAWADVPARDARL